MPIVVVIAHDDRCRAELVAQVTEGGFAVRALANGWHAALLALDEVAAVILEASMPHADGPETVEAIREQVPEMPFIVICSADQDGDGANNDALTALGVDAMLTKPFAAGLLVNAVSDAIARRGEPASRGR